MHKQSPAERNERSGLIRTIRIWLLKAAFSRKNAVVKCVRSIKSKLQCEVDFAHRRLNVAHVTYIEVNGKNN